MEITLEQLNKEIEELQLELGDKLKEVKVVLSSPKDNKVIDAINMIFPDLFKGSSSYFVTFAMYLECLKLIRKAGRIKAQTTIARRQ